MANEKRPKSPKGRRVFVFRGHGFDHEEEQERDTRVLVQQGSAQPIDLDLFFEEDQSFCYDGFRDLTGIDLEPGQRAELQLVKVEDWIKRCRTCNHPLNQEEEI